MSPETPVDEASRLELARVNEELAALVLVTDSAISTLDLRQLLDVLLERLMTVMKADAGGILLLEGDRLVVRAMLGFRQDPAAQPPIHLGEGFGGRIAASGRPAYVADVATDPRIKGTFLRDEGIVSMLGVPLRTRDRLVGVLHADWRSPHEESARDVHLLSITAERCAAAIVNASLYEDLLSANAEADRVRERLTLALGAANLGVWDWDVPTGSVVWNVENERIFGLEPGTFDGTYETFGRFIHPDDLSGVRDAIGMAMGGAPYAPTFRIVRRDGEVRWLSVRGHFRRAPDGTPLRLLGVTADITEERRLAEEREGLLEREREARGKAERAEQSLANLLERVTDAFVAVDTEWRFVYVSRKAGETLGHRPEDLVGRSMWAAFPEGVGSPFQAAYEAAVRDQRPVFLEEYYAPLERWLDVRVYPSPDGLSIFFRDVTEKRRTDERLRATNEQLRALSARVQSVREEEAARISREIHDELGQLLTALRMDIRWLRSRVERLGGPEAPAVLSRVDAMAELTDQTVRSVQRISEELRPAVLDHLGLEAAIASQLAALAARSGIGTSLAGKLQDRRLPGPIETGVFRILQELLTNVARHSGASFVRVELGVVSADGGGEALVLRVSDNGRGVREEELGSPRSLGLAGIRERAFLLGGRAEIRGDADLGTLATVTIPCPGAAP